MTSEEIDTELNKKFGGDVNMMQKTLAHEQVQSTLTLAEIDESRVGEKVLQKDKDSHMNTKEGAESITELVVDELDIK